MRRTNLIHTLGAGFLVLAAALLGLVACSGAGENAPAFGASQGKHPQDWINLHFADYVKRPDSCQPCHGSTKDPSHSGGTSGVSCFKCHASPDHPAGWAARSQHGRLGAQAAPSAFKGMASCTKCHATDYRGVGTAVSCMTCHTKAPHPSRPWTSDVSGHDKTEPANAPACFTCHADGANSTVKPKTPPTAGSAPGCFNNTMCHGRVI